MKLPAQWENLAEREKLIVGIGGVVVIVILIYMLLIEPFFSALNDLQNQVQTKRGLISWLQPAAQRIQQFSSQGYHLPQTVAGNLTDTINSSLQAHQLHSFVTQLTPINNQQAKIVFKTVPFDSAMDWLTALWLSNGIQIKQATIISTNIPGLVGMQLVLSIV